jgi:cyclophilin family peptidyl-prolyl cis-trans isomerase
LLAIGAALASLCGCGGGQDPTAAASAPVVCKPAKKQTPWNGQYNPPGWTAKRDEDLVALVMTSCGPFRIALDTARAPKTVSSFAKLARNGFYENQDFDRIAPNAMIQTGDPGGTGTNSSGPGYSVLEEPPADLTYTRGVVAMAKRPSDPPGYSRSQFFIVLADDARLPPEYALIGKVDEGMDVVDRIGEFGSRSEEPTKTVVIEWIWARKPTPMEEETGRLDLP